MKTIFVITPGDVVWWAFIVIFIVFILIFAILDKIHRKK